MRLANLIGGSKPSIGPERSTLDRRWCSERRVAERRKHDLPVATERRKLKDRRASTNRRTGVDRRGSTTIKTSRFHPCSKEVGDHRPCGQPAILRSSTGWRCFWHLDQRFERRNS